MWSSNSSMFLENSFCMSRSYRLYQMHPMIHIPCAVKDPSSVDVITAWTTQCTCTCMERTELIGLTLSQQCSPCHATSILRGVLSQTDKQGSSLSPKEEMTRKNKKGDKEKVAFVSAIMKHAGKFRSSRNPGDRQNTYPAQTAGSIHLPTLPILADSPAQHSPATQELCQSREVGSCMTMIGGNLFQEENEDFHFMRLRVCMCVRWLINVIKYHDMSSHLN